jgi:hypothetical protein
MRAVRAGVTGLGVVSLLGYGVGFRRVVGGGDGTLVAYVVLFVGLFVLYLGGVWLVLRRPADDPGLLGLVLGFGLLFRLVLLPTPVVLSSDVHRYLWDGRVQRAGFNPYRHPPAAAELAALRDPLVYPEINRPTKRTVYPPGSEALFLLVARLEPDSLLVWRLVLLSAEVATGLLLLELLRRLGAPRPAIVVYAWAPLVVFEGVQAGHLEVAVLPAILLALRWRQAGHMGRAGVALGVAVSMKLYPAVLLLVWWRRGQWRLGLACGAVVAAGYLAYLPGAGGRVLGFLPEYFGSAEDFNIGLRYFLTGWIPVRDPILREAIRGVTMLGLVGALLVVLARIARDRREDAEGVFRATMTAAAAYLVLVPTAMHAWYAVWIMPFLAVSPSPAWLWFTGAVSLSYLTYVWGPAELPFWLRALEFVPLYGLLAWEYRTGRLARPGSGRRAEWAAPVPGVSYLGERGQV